MKEFLKKVWEKLDKPTKGTRALTYSLVPLLIAGSLSALFLEYEGKWWSAFVYALFALSALGLAYAAFLFCKDVPRIRAWSISLMKRNAVTEKMLKNYPFRTLLFSAFSLACSLLYSLYNGIMSLYFHSVWYGALCGYYAILVCMRGGIVLYHGRKKGERSIVTEINKYRNVGWLLIVTILALSVAILQMVAERESFVHAGLTIYVSASYTFYKITMSIINVLKARKFDLYTIQAIRSVNFADALVSILALQTAMFQSFGNGGVGEAVANALTGGAVCVLVLALGVFMIVKGNRRLKKEYARTKI